MRQEKQIYSVWEWIPLMAISCHKYPDEAVKHSWEVSSKVCRSIAFDTDKSGFIKIRPGFINS